MRYGIGLVQSLVASCSVMNPCSDLEAGCELQTELNTWQPCQSDSCCQEACHTTGATSCRLYSRTDTACTVNDLQTRLVMTSEYVNLAMLCMKLAALRVTEQQPSQCPRTPVEDHPDPQSPSAVCLCQRCEAWVGMLSWWACGGWGEQWGQGWVCAG